jgi:hypothetical protein
LDEIAATCAFLVSGDEGGFIIQQRREGIIDGSEHLLGGALEESS